MSDHMLVVDYHPETGWTDPVIKPYGPLLIDPISSCLQYSTNLFEGMKVRAILCLHSRHLLISAT